MNRRTAMLLSGAITAFALMLVVGLVYGADRFNSAAAPVGNAVTGSSGDARQASTADVAALQQQVQTLKGQLQQAYTELQTAYDQISTLRSQSAGGRFRNRSSGTSQQNPFGNHSTTPRFGRDD